MAMEGQVAECPKAGEAESPELDAETEAVMAAFVSSLDAPQSEESTACQQFFLSDREDEYEDVQTPAQSLLALSAGVRAQSLLALSAGVQAKVDSAGFDALAHSWVSALIDAHAEEVITRALSSRVRNRSAFATRMARALWHQEEEESPHCQRCPMHCPAEAEASPAEESAAAEAPPAETEAPAQVGTEEGEDAEAPQAEESVAAEAPPVETEAPAQEGTEEGEDAEAEEGYDHWPEVAEGNDEVAEAWPEDAEDNDEVAGDARPWPDTDEDG